MLFETDVINAVCRELQKRGYYIEQKLTTTQHGDDIIAIKSEGQGFRLYIEAKGETSSRKNSKRYGKLFDGAQTRIHVAEAFYKAAEVLTRETNQELVRTGIALPDNRLHRESANAIRSILMKIEIAIFWVKQDGTVEIESRWDV